MRPSPVRLTVRPDQPGRWLWLVKWLMLVRHYIVLAMLWVAFIALTLVAYVAVVVDGRYEFVPAGGDAFQPLLRGVQLLPCEHVERARGSAQVGRETSGGTASRSRNGW